MSESLTERLARIRCAYPLWTVRRVRKGAGFTAHYCDRRTRLWAADLTSIETALWRTGRGNRGPKPREQR